VFIFGLAAAFVDGVPTRRSAQDLLDGFPVAPSDGTRFVQSPHGSAGLSRWVVVRRDEQAAPSWDATRELLFCGDVRLYNRPELFSELDIPASDRDCPDLELARRAYLRWGHESPLHLVGDFAFAAWDDDRRTLFAARDHLGSSPLYFRKTSEGIVVASQLQQMIRLLNDPSEEIEAAQILDQLTEHVSDPRRTFFRNVVRLRAGHRLVVTADDVAEHRYWFPPATPDASFTYEENLERLRGVFRRAVRDRLESDRPIVAHSSGGFDSSTILMVSDEIYRSEPGRPPLVMASALAPGFACDESNYMDAVASRVSFEGIRWNVVEETSSSFSGVFGGAPWLRIGLGGGPRRDLEIARERGARVLVSGFMGDEVWYAGGVLRDFVRRGRLDVVLRHVRRGGHGLSALRHSLDWGLGILDPSNASTIAHHFDARFAPLPEWMGPCLREIYPPAPEPVDFVPLPSHLLTALWARLTRPRTSAQIERMTDYGREDGLEVRLPHADVRLIECIMSVPWTQRDPMGHHRRTGRDALGPLLPSEFRSRRGQKPWTDVWNATSYRRAQGLAPLFRTGHWASAPFVDRGIARAMFTTALTGVSNAPPKSLSTILAFGGLEAWLCQLLRYNVARS
jgi:asparagine synthase (glutamine-hydrolysing)